MVLVDGLEQGYRGGGGMLGRRLNPKRPGLQEPLGDTVPEQADPIGEHGGRPVRSLSDVGPGGHTEHRGPGDQTRVVITGPQSVAGHGGAHLPVEARIGVRSPALKHLADGPGPLGATCGVEPVP